MLHALWEPQVESGPSRKYVRYPLGVPVIFTWQDPGGEPQQGGGFTRDISAGGVFLFSPTCPPVGAAVRFDVFLPPLPGLPRSLRMKGEGRVLRVEPSARGTGRRGFAAVSEKFQLDELDNGH